MILRGLFGQFGHLSHNKQPNSIGNFGVLVIFSLAGDFERKFCATKV